MRVLRLRAGWRQEDLAAKAGGSRETISRIERGQVRGVTVGVLEKVADVLGASLDLLVRYQGAELDRLVDAGHAQIQDAVAAALTDLGWIVRVEVSFNHFGDRGRADIVAFHPMARILLVVEVKTALGNLQETLGRLDVKVRVAGTIAAECGWTDVAVAVPVLVVADTRAARRVVAAHASLFGRYRLRGRQALAWMRRPELPRADGAPMVHETSGITWTDRCAGSPRAKGQGWRLMVTWRESGPVGAPQRRYRSTGVNSDVSSAQAGTRGRSPRRAYSPRNSRTRF